MPRDADAFHERYLRAAARLNAILTWAMPALVVLLLCQAAWARITLGRWPVVYHDDVTGAVATGFRLLEGCAVWLIVLGWPAWIFSLPSVWLGEGRKATAGRLLLFLGSLAIIVAAARLDPYGFMEWWLD